MKQIQDGVKSDPEIYFIVADQTLCNACALLGVKIPEDTDFVPAF
jgi:hypothetical protein